jgi:hypothetical protein
MIALATPPQINSVLGGNVPVGYDKLVLSPFTLDPVAQSISGTLRLTSTSAPQMQPVTGWLSINVPTSELVLEVKQLDFYRRIVLSAAQNNSVLSIIANAQNALESGLVSLGVVNGTQSSGS